MENPRLALDVYVITSAGLVPGRGHREVALAAAEGGAAAVQLRAPELDDDQLLALARELAPALRERGVLFVVNDRIDVALESGALGVHLGQDDLPSESSEGLEGLVLGVSVDTAEEAIAAQRLDADYLGVTVWTTTTKPEARPVGLEGLRRIVAATTLPVVGVGGIDASNAAEVMAAGARGVAVVSAVGAAPDPVAATRKLVSAVRVSEWQGHAGEEVR
jgi:thiamine-phosphate pyrophosphorylase